MEGIIDSKMHGKAVEVPVVKTELFFGLAGIATPNLKTKSNSMRWKNSSLCESDCDDDGASGEENNNHNSEEKQSKNSSLVNVKTSRICNKKTTIRDAMKRARSQFFLVLYHNLRGIV